MLLICLKGTLQLTVSCVQWRKAMPIFACVLLPLVLIPVVAH